MKNSHKFWLDKNVLVTGNTGFKGSWLSIWLDSMGANLTGYSLEPNTSPSLFKETGLNNRHKTFYNDIRDLKSLTQVVKNTKPEIVFHLAAQPLVRDSYDDPIYTYETNVMGTANLLNALKDSSSIRTIIIVTTDKCYENKEWVWGYRESDRLGGHDPYSSSKACAELVTQSFRDSFFNSMGVGVATVRAGNVIGGGDWTHNRIVPDILRAISSHEDLILRNPKAVRPWQHVLEPINGYLSLAQKLYLHPKKFNSSWNFGPNFDDNRTVLSIANTMINQSDSNIKINIKQSSLKETTLLKLDISKSTDRLDWNPQLKISETINLILNWHKNFDQGKDAFQLCIEDIQNFRKY